MNIYKAIEHFNWRFRNGIKPTKRDIEAFNSIIEFVDNKGNANLTQNESLCKLFIYVFISKCQYNFLSSENALKSINDILKSDLDYWIDRLHLSLPLMQINALGFKDFNNDIDLNNLKQLEELNNRIFDKYEEDIIKALKTKTTKEQVIKWLEGKITAILNLY